MMDILGDYIVYMFFIITLFVVLGIISDRILPAIEIVIKHKGKGRFSIKRVYGELCRESEQAQAAGTRSLR